MVEGPTTEINTPTDNLEIRNVHIACLQPTEDITQRFSKLNRLIRVIGYCKRFISNCRNPKANRKSTILSTQDLDQALICCVKIVQQISYAQEIRNLMEQQEVAASISLKTLLPFIDKEGLLRVGGRLQQSNASLSNNTSDDFTFISSLHKIGCLSRARKTSPCWATTSNSISTRVILDTKNEKLGENSHSSVHNLL